jgi:hypothetical protein
MGGPPCCDVSLSEEILAELTPIHVNRNTPANDLVCQSMQGNLIIPPDC